MKQILNVITIPEIDRKILGDARALDCTLRQLRHQMKIDMEKYKGNCKFTITVDLEKYDV